MFLKSFISLEIDVLSLRERSDSHYRISGIGRRESISGFLGGEKDLILILAISY